MSPHRWNQVVALFQAARAKVGGERVALLDSACSDDPSLRMLIEQMLRDDEAACSFLNEAPLEFFAAAPITRANTASDVRVLPGVKFGRYEIVTPIGRGGMGEVWLGHDPELDRRVALKFLAPEATLDGAMERLTREARAASALNHPNIVTVHEVIRHEETSIIVMEWVDGTALRAMCGAPQPLDRVVQLGLQIARALAAAHAHGIVHRDIKPENILVRRDGYVKVLDFGLARRMGSEELTSSAGLSGGTLRYMSPEQARGEPISPASDVFSFGLTLYELATGRHAFPSDSPFGAVRAMLMNEPAAPSAVNQLVPARLNSLILAMIAKDAAARPSAEEVARTLDALQGQDKISPALVPGVWKWAVAAAVLITACFAAWRWKPAQNANDTPTFRQITTLVPENRATAAAISPNGKLVAYANVDGLFTRSIQNGETKALLAPRDYVVDRLAWFANSTNLVASGFSAMTNIPGVWMISATAQASSRLLRAHAREATPSPDGTRVAFISQDWSSIWVMRANGEEPREIVAGPGEDTFPLVFWSPDSRRLAFQRRHYSPERRRLQHGMLDRFYERSYESMDLINQKVTARVPQLGIASAAALPDGRILFLRYASTFADSPDQLWEVKTNVATGALVEAPHKIASSVDEVDPNETHIHGMSATLNGKLALVLKRSDQNAVFIGDFDEAAPRISNIRRLTFDERTSYPHAWTADSSGVIFESIRNGTWDLFRQDINRHTPITLVATPLMEALPHLSPNGHWVLYSAGTKIERGAYKLMRVPVEGGTPEEVPIGGPLDEFRCALGSGKRCVLRTTIGREYYAFYDLDPIRGKGRELARTKWTPNVTEDWDISPDGNQVAIPNHDPREARIRVVDLQPGSNQGSERDVILPGLADLNSVVWSASGQGWLVSLDMTVGKRMLYVYLDGGTRPLGDISGWAVPSPDGRRVAFMNTIIATNAWLIERH
jgi:hypothetical protein